MPKEKERNRKKKRFSNAANDQHTRWDWWPKEYKLAFHRCIRITINSLLAFNKENIEKLSIVFQFSDGYSVKPIALKMRWTERKQTQRRHWFKIDFDRLRKLRWGRSATANCVQSQWICVEPHTQHRLVGIHSTVAGRKWAYIHEATIVPAEYRILCFFSFTFFGS